jgi:hypothetical protein
MFTWPSRASGGRDPCKQSYSTRPPASGGGPTERGLHRPFPRSPFLCAKYSVVVTASLLLPARGRERGRLLFLDASNRAGSIGRGPSSGCISAQRVAPIVRSSQECLWSTSKRCSKARSRSSRAALVQAVALLALTAKSIASRVDGEFAEAVVETTALPLRHRRD